ncbi:MAG: hypothetical protein WD733_21385 [Bryobacterales bacterium]
MVKIADYAVLRDGTFDLESGAHFELPPFFPPADLVPGTGESKAILCYKARPLQQAPFSPQVDLKISLKFQLLQIETIKIKDDNVRGLWETFSAAELSQTVGNVFIFTSESGRVRISDVVLWYQRSIAG